MIIDCDTCTAPADACADCVVTFLTVPVGAPGPRRTPPHRRVAGGVGLAPRAAAVELDDAERAAIDTLAAGGLVPPLRLQHAG